MKIKTKLNFGVGFLFIMIFSLSVLSGWYVYQLKKDTNNILKANYNTLLYSRNMILALEDMKKNPQVALFNFENNLKNQSKNITEVGEKEATQLVYQHYHQLRKDLENPHLVSSVRKDLTELMRLNMDAIERKSFIAEDTAQDAIVVISVVGTLCFIFAFILLVNLPSSIADPIKELTESTKQIANQNYKNRVHFQSNSEFGDLANSFNTMAEKLEEYSESKLEKILKGKKRIETLIDNMHDPVIGIDEDKIILFINEEALMISGLKREDLIGKPIQNIAVNNDLIREIIKDIFPDKDQKKNNSPLKIYAHNKESYFEKEVININIVPTGEQDSRFIGQVIMLRNITAFKELDLAKTNFLGTVSHEFKTPIASIQLGTQLLQNQNIGSLNTDQRELVLGIMEDSNRLLKITRELLNITQVESGAIHIEPQITIIQPILKDAVETVKSVAEQKNISIKSPTVQDDIKIMADAEKTSWVLTNLLSNAIRYSYENSEINLRIDIKENQIIFSVKDHGQGMQQQYLDRIFDKYYKIPGNKKDGTGLGLSICKEFIEAQGGKLWVESSYGEGSTFYFQLPLCT